MTLFRITGIALIALPIAFNLVFFALGRAFDYPGILRQPTETILTRFTAGGKHLIMLWYAFALTALLAIPVALLLHQVFAPEQPALAGASALIGVLGGVVQAMGLLRWSLLVPTLAAQYTAAKTPAERDTIGLIFNAFHQYVGVVVGEHLGYLFTGAWTILLGVMMLTSPLFSPILGIAGIIAALGILTGMAEPFGWKPAGRLTPSATSSGRCG